MQPAVNYSAPSPWLTPALTPRHPHRFSTAWPRQVCLNHRRLVLPNHDGSRGTLFFFFNHWHAAHAWLLFALRPHIASDAFPSFAALRFLCSLPLVPPNVLDNAMLPAAKHHFPIILAPPRSIASGSVSRHNTFYSPLARVATPSPDIAAPNPDLHDLLP